MNIDKKDLIYFTNKEWSGDVQTFDTVINASKDIKYVFPKPYGIDLNDKHVQSVINKFAHRSEVGFAKYGTTLERKDLNLTEWLNHLQEELMDATLYIEKLKDETNTTTKN